MDPKADGVSGMLEKLRLSKIERKGLKIGGMSGVFKGKMEPQAVGKVLSEKPVQAKALELSLVKGLCLVLIIE
jgi:hypothetical protein